MGTKDRTPSEQTMLSFFILVSLIESAHGFQTSMSHSSAHNRRGGSVVMRDIASGRRHFVTAAGYVALVGLPNYATADGVTDEAAPAEVAAEAPAATNDAAPPPANDVPIPAVTPSADPATGKGNAGAGVLLGGIVAAGVVRSNGDSDSSWKNNYYASNTKALKQGQTLAQQQRPQVQGRVEGTGKFSFRYQSELSGYKGSTQVGKATGKVVPTYITLTDAQVAAYGEPAQRELTSVG